MSPSGRRISIAISKTTDGWQDIPVTLGGGDEQDDGDSGSETPNDKYQASKGKTKQKNRSNCKEKNHYDDEQLGKLATLDLPARPGEDIGMMYGGSIQVLRGDQYQVIHHDQQKRIVLLWSEEDKKNKRSNDASRNENDRDKNTTTESATTTNSSDREVKKKKKKKTAEQATSNLPSATTIDPTKTPVDSAKASRKRRIPPETDSNHASTNDQPSVEDPTGSNRSQDYMEDENDVGDDTENSGWQQVQQSWSHACGGAILDPILCRALYKQKFGQPTPIQAATLSACILGRRNLVGAAPTGSGKTLAFLLPILQSLLEERLSTTTQQRCGGIVRALIVTPTRELATQIYNECEKLMPKQCVTLVGGIAFVKQVRLLSTIRPPILVGTPGRLWQMISTREHDHIKDLSQLKFLVLDEADRMTQDHSFPQLIQILERIHEKNRGIYDDDSSDEDDWSSDSDDQDRLLSLPGIRGEAKTTMLTPDLMLQIQGQRDKFAPERKEVHDEASNPTDEDQGGYDEDYNVFEDESVTKVRPTVHRQTFIYSATLTLPYTSTTSSNRLSKKKQSGRARKLPLEGGLAEILEKTHAMGKTKVVDLSSSTTIDQKSGESLDASLGSQTPKGVKLPPGLKLELIKCTKLHKDSHLYAYLLTTTQGASGPALVFCNSIAAVRRVGATLETLGLSVRILHAHMQQRARFKAVESLSKDDSRMVVVSTDVAARGLDMPSVATVIHYDAARTVDTFVHRAGRTARGMGKSAVGASLSLIDPSEDKSHNKIVQALNVPFQKVPIDGRLLTSSQERVNLASKVVLAGEKMNKKQSSNAWFLEKASQADLELDDDLLEDDRHLSAVERVQQREATRAKQRLTQLLAQPMKTQRFGKFMSTNSATTLTGVPVALPTEPRSSQVPKMKRPRL